MSEAIDNCLELVRNYRLSDTVDLRPLKAATASLPDFALKEVKEELEILSAIIFHISFAINISDLRPTVQPKTTTAEDLLKELGL